VWSNGRTRNGTAEEVLRAVQEDAQPDSALKGLSLGEYARLLVENATYFFPDGVVPEFLAAHEYATPFDRALEYLAAMPSSGVRILSRK